MNQGEYWTGRGSVDWTKLTGVNAPESDWLAGCLDKAKAYHKGSFVISPSWSDSLSDAAAYSVADLPGFDERIRKWVASDARSAEDADDTKGELIVGRVLRRLVGRLEARPDRDPLGGKTFDQQAHSSCGVPLEVEVCSPREKPAWRKGVADGRALIDKAAGLGIGGVVIGVLDDLSQDEVVREVLEATWQLTVGKRAESANRWFVHDAPFAGSFPEWWPKQYVTPATLRFSFTADLASGAIQRGEPVQLLRGFSSHAYANALEAKAVGGQLTGESVGLVAVHVTKLPGWVKWADENLWGYFPAWPKVSAVLAVRCSSTMTSLFDDLALFTNPHASRPIPQSVVERLPALRARVTYPYWGDGEGVTCCAL
jgi:hypothetical protein